MMTGLTFETREGEPRARIAAPERIDEALQQDGRVKWAWSCRRLVSGSGYRLSADTALPQPGDVVAVRVQSIGNHGALMTVSQARLRLYEEDVVVAVLGNRYATDAFEGEVRDVEPLHVLTAAGLLGTVRSRHKGVKPPTEVSFLGYLTEPGGARLNSKRRLFHPRRPDRSIRNNVLVVGTGMNSGKTTTLAKLVHGLVRRGVRVGAAKLTGSVSHRDMHELEASGAHFVRDFSDYGFPSTYLCSEAELHGLFDTIRSDALEANIDVLLLEIADGVLQRETAMLLGSPELREEVSSIVLSASCSTSALRAIQEIQSREHRVTCVSGRITNSPLFVRELEAHTAVPVVSSADGGASIADRVFDEMAHTG